MNELELYTTAFGVYLEKMPEKPEEAAALAKKATKLAMAEWAKEDKKDK